MLGNFREEIIAKEELKKTHGPSALKMDYTTVMVKPITDKGFQTRLNTLMKPYKRLLKKDKVDPRIWQNVLAKCLSEHIVTGWNMLTIPHDVMKKDFPHFNFEKDKEGVVELPYSQKLCEEILSHKNYADFLDSINDFATDEANYIAEQEAEDEKNLQNSCAINSEIDSTKSITRLQENTG